MRPDRLIEFGMAQAEYLGGELEITVHLLSWKLLQEANKRLMRKRRRADGSVVRIPMSGVAVLYDLLDELPEETGEAPPVRLRESRQRAAGIRHAANSMAPSSHAHYVLPIPPSK